MPANVYRVIYIHYARVCKFVHKLKLAEDNFEIFGKLFDDIMDAKLVEIEDGYLFLENDHVKIGFSL